MLKILENIALTNPASLLIFLAFVSVFFKTEILAFVKQRLKVLDKIKRPNTDLKKVKRNIIGDYSNQAKVFYFDREVTAYDQEEFATGLQGIVNAQRKKRQRLVFDLSKVRLMNLAARRAFLLVTRKVITENNIDFLIVLPGALDAKYLNINKLVDNVQQDIRDNPSEVIKMKIDQRNNR